MSTIKSLSFNTILNDIEILQNEIDEFVSQIQRTKEGKLLSYEHLKNIYILYKIKTLQNHIATFNGPMLETKPEDVRSNK